MGSCWHRPIVTPEEWPAIETAVGSRFREAGLPLPWIYPGSRFGSTSAAMGREVPGPVLRVGHTVLFSARLVEAFDAAGIQAPLRIHAHLQSKRPVGEYFEIVPAVISDLAPEAQSKVDRCPTCGKVEGRAYHRLLPLVGGAADFVWVAPAVTALVSGRVREVIERHTDDVWFIESEKIGVGPGTRSLLELSYEAKVERQWQRRRN